ncbi:MAG TPA: AlpA family transcriptional regulator [Gammaproteobacteria bacterium]|nr:AlpA family transcriptional regulator [Gammaproteobacteria bacterium]
MGPERILRLPTVKERTGKSRSSIYLDMEKGSFPTSVKIGLRSVGWTESSINAWIEDRVKQGQHGCEAPNEPNQNCTLGT